MLQIIQNNLEEAPKTLSSIIWNKILNGIKLNGKEYKYWLKIKKENIYKFELIENGCILYFLNGTKIYYKNGLRHRDDGPTIIYSDGYKEYWKNGQVHNDNGPAVIWPDGGKDYYKYGKRIG